MARNPKHPKTATALTLKKEMYPFKVGFLHIGKPEHGVCRYGRLLAQAALQHQGIQVVEYDVILSGNPMNDSSLLTSAARVLSNAHIVQIQFTEKIWGEASQRLQNLWTFLRECHCPVVVTLHDTEPSSDFAVIGVPPLRFWGRCHFMWKLVKRECRIFFLKHGIIKNFTPSNSWIRYWILREVCRAFVCTQEEFRRLGKLTESQKISIIPHFVEKRERKAPRYNIRESLGLDQWRVVTLLGFIYPGKGYTLLLETLALLPKNLYVVFAGGTCRGFEFYLEQLVSLSKKLGVADRVRITGYLEEEELEDYLWATDLAVCPYRVCYASSSLATWISAGRPILASDLPQFREYHVMEPDVIRLFSSYTPRTFAESIMSMLAIDDSITVDGMKRLQKKFEIMQVFEQHLRDYQRIYFASLQGDHA